MRFTLEVKLGNEAMQTGADLAYAIERCLEGVRGKLGDDANLMFTADYVQHTRSGSVRDSNGNTVGKWEVRDDSLENGQAA